MSGINATIIMYKKKGDFKKLLESKTFFNKKNRNTSEFRDEFSVNEYFNINEEELFVSGNFLIEYGKKVENFGYPDDLWSLIIDLVPNPISAFDFLSMTRNKGSAYIILKYLSFLIDSEYSFYIVNNKPNSKLLDIFSFPDIKRVDSETYLLSSKIIAYWLKNNIYDCIGYN